MPELMLKLGKRAPRIDARTFMLEKYTARVEAPPAEAYFQEHVTEWPVYLNTQLGDCVPAAAGHMIEQWTAYAGKPALPTDDEILAAYEAIGGFVPGDPLTDNGCDMLTTLKYWRNTGIAGHEITAFMSLISPAGRSDPEFAVNLERNIRVSTALFGNCFLGLDMPLSAQLQTNAVPGIGWHVDDSQPFEAEPGSWGGHCVPVVGYDAETVTVVTWGMLVNVSWHFLGRYVDEAYAVASTDWIEANGLSPSGFDLTTLEEDLQRL